MFALSTAQQIVWLHEQRQPGGCAYHFTAVLDLIGPLDEAALRAALAAVIDRHDMFRTALVADEQPPLQRTVRAVPVPISIVELPEPSGPRWDVLLRDHANQPFDLTTPPLVRWTLVRAGPDRHRLLHTEHHLVHDGRSFSVMLRDLFTAYRAALGGQPIALPAAPLYSDFVAWQAGPDAAGARDQALRRWQERLAGASFGHTVPGTRRRAGRKRFVGAQYRQRIEPDLAARVREAARRGRHTEFSLLFAMFTALAHRYNGDPELVVGTATGSRPPGFAGTVGMFVNAVPVLVRCEPGQSARDYVGHVMGALLAGLEGAAAPVQDITHALGASTAGQDNPLFRLMFSAYDSDMPDLDLAGLRAEVTGGVNPSSSRMDIDVVVVLDDRMTIGVPSAGSAGMLLLWDYDTDRYDPEFIALFAARYAWLLAAYAADPDSPLGELRFTDPAEPTPASIGACPPGRAASDDLFARFAEVAGTRSGAAALIAGPRTVSYRELADTAGRLAERLAAAGVTAGSRVAVVLPRSADAVVALLACLRLGAAFCPLAPTDPPARRRTLLDRLQPAATVSAGDQGPLVEPGEAAAPGGTAGIAYIMHTSGSTGMPKPVAVSRASLTSHAAAIGAAYGLREADCVLQFAQPAFDVFLEETLPTLLAGGTVVIAASELPTGAELAALLGLRAITVANLPTGYAAAVLPELATALTDWPRLPLRLLVLGGERVTADFGRQVMAELPGTDLINAYGVTEATITSTCWRWAADDPGTVPQTCDDLPVGRPLAGTEIYVVDRDQRPVAAGIVGEIAIGGAGVALGYLDDRAATAARFGPLSGVPGRCYRTGDLGYWRPDGQLCFVGRRDNQVKLLGHRIELEEVESVAAAVLRGARRAVVADESGPVPQLVGFVETSTGITGEQVTRALAERLPRTMLPARWIAVERIPLLAGDKPDRAALAALIPAALEPAGPAPGRYDQVRAVWEEVLGTGDLDASSDFFGLGGHSLQAIQIVTRLRESFGGDLPLALLFDEPVLGRFAAAVHKIAEGNGYGQ